MHSFGHSSLVFEHLSEKNSQNSAKKVLYVGHFVEGLNQILKIESRILCKYFFMKW